MGILNSDAERILLGAPMDIKHPAAVTGSQRLVLTNIDGGQPAPDRSWDWFKFEL